VGICYLNTVLYWGIVGLLSRDIINNKNPPPRLNLRGGLIYVLTCRRRLPNNITATMAFVKALKNWYSTSSIMMPKTFFTTETPFSFIIQV